LTCIKTGYENPVVVKTVKNNRISSTVLATNRIVPPVVAKIVGLELESYLISTDKTRIGSIYIKE